MALRERKLKILFNLTSNTDGKSIKTKLLSFPNVSISYLYACLKHECIYLFD